MADILIVDDQDRYLELCRKAIPEHRYRGPARNAAEAEAMLVAARGRVDAVLLDVHFDIPEADLLGEGALEDRKRRQGLEILARLRTRWPDLPVVLMTSREELALESESADEEFTYFLDDDYVDARALQGQLARITAERAAPAIEGPVFWGRSAAMQRIRQRLSVLARGRLPVVLLGPTGTGKSLLARHFVHARSGRAGRFLSVDLSTVPTDLMAAHLFGSVKGAYTGSVSDRTGAFELADRGTLFLDELGNLTDAAQKMLLTVLQEGVVTRVGDLKERTVDVKLVVATNEDLARRVAEGTFRADLWMRLNPAAAIRLPSLVERGLALGELVAFSAEHALARTEVRGLLDEYRETAGVRGSRVEVVCGTAPAAREGVLVLLFPERVMRMLRGHEWPGNFRELSMTIENAISFALAEMLDAPGGDRADTVTVRPAIVGDLLLATAPRAVLAADPGQVVVNLQAADTLNKVSVGCETQYFRALFLAHEGDFGRMAEILLGDAAHARKVQLRFNQLGLKVRELKGRTT